MHEQTLMRDLMRQIEEVARREGAVRVSGIRVRVGDLSHLTPERFREHFEEASRGTLAEGAAVSVEPAADPAQRQAVVLESVDLDFD